MGAPGWAKTILAQWPLTTTLLSPLTREVAVNSACPLGCFFQGGKGLCIILILAILLLEG